MSSCGLSSARKALTFHSQSSAELPGDWSTASQGAGLLQPGEQEAVG